MELNFDDAIKWIRCNIRITDIIRAHGGMKCPNADQSGSCPKLAVGGTNKEGAWTFSCMTTKCSLEHGDGLDMYMHLNGVKLHDAVEQLCATNGITLIKKRYEVAKNKGGWQYWAWYDPDNKLMLVKGRCKEKDMANQQRPATAEEVALGVALSEEPVFKLDENGKKIVVDKSDANASDEERKLGFALAQPVKVHLHTRGKKSGLPYEVNFNNFYKSHMVGCITYCKPEWTYLADIWAKKAGDIFVVEGEKDADVLSDMGYLATTTGGSSQKWSFEWANKLQARTRFHFRDNDLAGAMSLIHRVETFLEIIGEDYWVRIPGHDELLESHGADIRDFLNSASDEQFRQLMASEAVIPFSKELKIELEYELDAAKKKFKEAKTELKNADDYVKTEKLQVDPAFDGNKEDDSYSTDNEPFCRLTETGNGKRFTHRYNGKLKHVPQGFHSEWLIWMRSHWHIDRKNKKCFQLTQQISEMLRREISQREKLVKDINDEEDPDVIYIKKMRRWADTSESVSNRKNSMESAGSEPEVLADFEEFDKDPLLFNIKNGTVNLKTGLFRPHDKADLITKRANVSYDKNAKCPKFDAFMDDIMMGEKEVIRYIQRLLGYCLTGLTREECMHMCVGDGQNGKGVLLELVAWIMGDYAITAEADMFLIKRSEAAASSDVARLMGVRLALASETNEGAKFNEAKLKSLTSRDRITARFNHKDPFEFDQTHKIMLATNKLITVTGKDRGIWRRLRVIRFENNIPDSKVDKDLRVKLMDEAPGILNWMIQGFMEYQKLNGLRPPQKILDWREEYKESMDYMQDFFETYCVIETTASIDKKKLFEEFFEWQTKIIKNRDPYNFNTFCKIMVQHNFKEGRIGSGPRYWKGLRLKTENERIVNAQKYEEEVRAFGNEELLNDLGIEAPF